MNKNIYVYIITNTNNDVFYVGVTNNLKRRIFEHKNQIKTNSFTKKYNCFKLVYIEHISDIKTAITQEKQLKNWKREWKIKLIKEQNPKWITLIP